MSELTRSQTMAKVRHASIGAAPAEIAAHLSSLGDSPSAPPLDPDPLVSFGARVISAGGTIQACADKSSLVKAVGAHLYEQYRTHKLVAGNDPRLAALPWRDGGVLPRFGSAVDGDPVAVSFAQLAIAETGSVALLTGRANPSANNLLPLEHLVIVDTSTVFLTLEQAWQVLARHMDKYGRPRGVNLISGPSSTADIGGQLVMGAHGPQRWHILLLGAIEEAAMQRAHALATPGQSR